MHSAHLGDPFELQTLRNVLAHDPFFSVNFSDSNAASASSSEKSSSQTFGAAPSDSSAAWAPASHLMRVVDRSNCVQVFNAFAAASSPGRDALDS